MQVETQIVDPKAREFLFTDADFQRVRELIYRLAGISLSPVKRDMVYSRLARRLRQTGHTSFAAYLDELTNSKGREWEEFVNALTTNLTSFFREEHHFPILADHLKSIGTARPITIWCSASSTGEEPYSIAMTVVETFGEKVSHVSIVASDLDTNVLTVARNGIYPIDRIEKLSPERHKRFFLRGSGSQEGQVRVRPALQQMIRFQRINLLEPDWDIPSQLDVIFCRNVMIYFDKQTQYKILSRFVPLIRLDGILFAGHSESFLHAANLFRSRGKTVYVPAAKHKS